MKKNRRLTIWIAALAVIVALSSLCVGCGSNGQSGQDQTQAQAQTTTQTQTTAQSRSQQTAEKDQTTEKDQNAEKERERSGVHFEMRCHFIDPEQSDTAEDDQHRANRKSVAVDPLKIPRKEEGNNRDDADSYKASAQDLA